MDLSVLIVSYNTRDLTLACVESVFRETRSVHFEVIVVDDGSRDGTAEAAAALRTGRTSAASLPVSFWLRLSQGREGESAWPEAPLDSADQSRRAC